MSPLTEGVARVVEVVDAPVVSDAPTGVAPVARGLAPPAEDAVLPFGHPALPTLDLELIDTMMIAPAPTMRRRGGRGPT
ncbi:hypothetical protein CsSME_00024257 [Camellia sinensis var. sinensis]